MLIICRNDFPLYVCPETTTRKEAEAYAKKVQDEMNHDRADNVRPIYIHVQIAQLLTEFEIKEKLT